MMTPVRMPTSLSNNSLNGANTLSIQSMNLKNVWNGIEFMIVSTAVGVSCQSASVDFGINGRNIICSTGSGRYPSQVRIVPSMLLTSGMIPPIVSRSTTSTSNACPNAQLSPIVNDPSGASKWCGAVIPLPLYPTAAQRPR